MKIPKEIRTYCPTCKTHTVHTVKLAPKRSGEGRALAEGNRRHARKMKGHGGKRAGKVTVKKLGKRQKIMLTCTVCKKKHERVIGTRTKRKLEIIAK
ncbi:50S ribosomal protein L44e [Candidatus Micrarchaeota archaeon]|nr:50S ribosomal protein L44e [Candidatus Micrarchaeota archaeon]